MVEGGVVMSAFLPPLVATASFGLYFLLTFGLAIYRRVPWEILFVMTAAAGLAVHQLVQAPGAATAAGAALTVGLVVFACWFLFVFSMYGPREDRPRVGDRFPDFTLPASDGGTFRLAEARGRRLLVLFYRGAW
jgi:AhpC/TSA family protein